MKSIYNITKGQFVSIWLFGTVGWLISIGMSETGSELGDILIWLIPFIVVFYTIGYRNHKKNK